MRLNLFSNKPDMGIARILLLGKVYITIVHHSMNLTMNTYILRLIKLDTTLKEISYF